MGDFYDESADSRAILVAKQLKKKLTQPTVEILPTVVCKACGQRFKRKGIAKHRRHCKGKKS